jgi:hypothetical protein
MAVQGGTVRLMSAQQSEHDGHSVIRLGGETAVVVPIDEYRRLKALESHATPEELEKAEADAVLAEYDEWVSAGRPGAMTHQEAMAQLLSGS